MAARSPSPDAPPDPREAPRYRLTEAAHYLHIPVSTLRGWVTGWDYRTRGGKRRAQPLIQPPEGAAQDGLLSFYNLVEAHILASLRRVHHVPMHKVRRALDLARRRKGAERPLLRARPSAEGDDLVLESGKEAEDQNGQCVFFFAVARPFTRIEWDQGGALPVRLYPWFAGEEPSAPRRIVIDPARAAGKPVIAETDIPTALVAARHRAGASVSTLAGSLGLDPSSIEDALRCELRSAA